jgi:hypothetical protein
MAICAAIGGFIIDWLAFYPGFMYIDSVDQYTQAVSFHYGDWHPPVMAGFWSVLNLVHRGPQVMLLFQLLLLWSSFYTIATTWCKGKLTFWALLLLVACAPYVQNFAGLIVKDAQMALCWLLATALLLKAMYYQRKMSSAEAIVSFLLITYGTLVRINALPGCIPLYFLWVEGTFGGGRIRKFVLLAAALTALLVVKVSLERFVLKTHKQYPEYKLILHDLAGIYARTGHNYFPPFITSHPGFKADYIATHYLTATIDNIWWNQDRDILFPPLTEETRPALLQAWKSALWEQPGTYLTNHYDGFLYFLQLKKRREAPFFYYYPYMHPNQFGFSFKENGVSKVVLGSVRINSRMPYMQPWCWLLVPVLLLAASLRMRAGSLKEIIVCLSLSSLLYLLPQFFIYQADTEFRYFYWNCIAASLSVVLLLGTVSKGQKKDPAAGEVS